MGRRSSPDTTLELSVSQLSSALKLDRATLSKRLQGVSFNPGPKGAKLYRLTDAIRACLVDFLGADQPGTYEEARTREMKAKAQLAELDLAVKRGHLLPADETEKLWSQYIGKANTRLGSISTRLAPLVLGMEDEAEVKALIDEVVDEVRSELQGDGETDTGDPGKSGEEVDPDTPIDSQSVGGPIPATEP